MNSNENITRPYYTVMIYDNWHGYSIYYGTDGSEARGYYNRIKISNEKDALALAKVLAKKKWPCGMEQVIVQKTEKVGWCVTESHRIFSAELDSAYAA